MLGRQLCLLSHCNCQSQPHCSNSAIVGFAKTLSCRPQFPRYAPISHLHGTELSARHTIHTLDARTVADRVAGPRSVRVTPAVAHAANGAASSATASPAVGAEFLKPYAKLQNGSDVRGVAIDRKFCASLTIYLLQRAGHTGHNRPYRVCLSQTNNRRRTAFVLLTLFSRCVAQSTRKKKSVSPPA
jgi:hypothetical protein